MNRQDIWKNGVLLKRGIEWTQPYGMPGYTSNPVKGCLHECQWEMPDGQIAECYAKTVAERLAQHAYPNGFASLSFHPKELESIERMEEGAGFFMDSMSDLMGLKVKEEWIEAVIQTMRNCPQHIFFILTKNAPRLRKYRWPENAWIGVSAPPTFMYGSRLMLEQQERWYDKALDVLGEIDVPIRWTSIEPLSWDVSALIEKHWPHFEWAVIGAASNGKQTHQPSKEHFSKAWEALAGKAMFLKGNIDRDLATEVCGQWWESYPMVTSDWRETRHVA